MRDQYDFLLNPRPPLSPEMRLRHLGRFLLVLFLPLMLIGIERYNPFIPFLKEYARPLFDFLVITYGLCVGIPLHYLSGSWFATPRLTQGWIISALLFAVLLAVLALCPAYVLRYWRTHRRWPHWELCLHAVFCSLLITVCLLIGHEVGPRWEKSIF